MDLKDLTPKTDTIEVTIVHPFEDKVLKNEDDSDMTITLYTEYSKQYKAELHRQTNIKLKRMQKNGGKVDMTAEQIEESAYEMMAAITKEWNITYEGKLLPLTLENAKMVYTELFWLREQLEAAMADAKDFTKA